MDGGHRYHCEGMKGSDSLLFRKENSLLEPEQRRTRENKGGLNESS